MNELGATPFMLAAQTGDTELEVMIPAGVTPPKTVIAKTQQIY